MGGCTIPNCGNTGKMGFRMYHIPKDSHRQALWVQWLRQHGWMSTAKDFHHCLLCEAHFDESQFEPRRPDKKLKSTAVPTIFSHSYPPPRPRHNIAPASVTIPVVSQSQDSTLSIDSENAVSIDGRTARHVVVDSCQSPSGDAGEAITISHCSPPQPEQRRQLKRQLTVASYLHQSGKKKKLWRSVVQDHSYIFSRDPPRQSAKKKLWPSVVRDHSYIFSRDPRSCDHSYSVTPGDTPATVPTISQSQDITSSPVVSDTQDSRPNVNTESPQRPQSASFQLPYNAREAMIVRLRQQVRALQRKNNLLQERLRLMTKKLQKFIHADQIEQLQGSRFGKWSEDTIQMAAKIRTEIGRYGYEYLRTSIGYPLPSYRTLCERTQTKQSKKAVLDTEVLDLLQLEVLQPTTEYLLVLDEVQLDN